MDFELKNKLYLFSERTFFVFQASAKARYRTYQSQGIESHA